jgi:integrase
MPTFYPPGTRKSNKTYIVRGRVGGRQYEITTEAGNERAAKAAWEDFASETRREQRDANRDRNTATFDWACDEYLSTRPQLTRNYVRSVNNLRSYFAGWFLKDMTADDVYTAAHKMLPMAKPQTHNSQVLIPAGAILHQMARRGLCNHIVLSMKKPKGVIRPVTYPSDLEILVKAASGELKALLMTFQIHGWRVTETIKIKREQIDWKRAQINRWVAKSQQHRRSAVDREVLKAWKELPERADGRLFSYRYRRAVYIAIDALIEEAGLDMHYRPHQSRRGLVTTLRNLGWGLDDIQQAGQWESRSSVVTYDQDNPERTRPMFKDLRGTIGAESSNPMKRKKA